MSRSDPDGLAALWREAFERALRYRSRVAETSPLPRASATKLRAAFGAGVPEQGRDPGEVIAALAAAAEPGLVGTTSPAFHAWVMGGSHPAGVAAEWLAAAWGQNAGTYQCSPAAAAAEECAGAMLLDLLNLPRDASVGFTTGATMASFVGLSAGRLATLERAGWDIEREGLTDAPEIRVFLGEEAHSTVFHALRLLGFGQRQLVLVEADAQGRMRAESLADAIAAHRSPSIVVAQAGHINSGAFDPLDEIARIARSHEAWLHIDGAFGLWARTSERHRHLAEGAEQADSCAVDGHKWLQVPYDCGYAILRDPQIHRRAMAFDATYLDRAAGDGFEPCDHVPELSRRARGFATWAVIQTLGRAGVAGLIEANCNNAARFAEACARAGGGAVEVLNAVVLNQVCIAPADRAGEEALAAGALAGIAEDGRWFVKGARWHDRPVLRFSFCGTPADPEKAEEMGTFVGSIFAEAGDGSHGGGGAGRETR